MAEPPDLHTHTASLPLQGASDASTQGQPRVSVLEVHVEFGFEVRFLGEPHPDHPGRLRAAIIPADFKARFGFVA